MSGGAGRSRGPVTGWGRTHPTVADVVRCRAAALSGVVSTAGPRGIVARGLGRSYGDAAQNAGGFLVELEADAERVVLDAAAGVARVSAAVSLDELLRVIVPAGFFVAVSPGTRFVTVGGAIAADIHGKNHHVDGSFGSHVTSIVLLLADGSTVEVGPGDELFWATVGGMGLTGVIVSATLALLPVETSRMRVDTTRLVDLDALFDEMTARDDRYRYSVAWIDLMAQGRAMGRSVLTRGDHARRDDLDDGSDPLSYAPRQLVTVPPLVPPSGVLNRTSVSAFNALWYARARRERHAEIQSIARFFHPLDLVGSWNRLYGSQGMVQYQFVVPFGEEDAMRRVVDRLSSSGAVSFLAVLKRFGPANRAPLSFPSAGWTLALDVPARTHGLGELLHGLDRLVLDAGGRHYLAKDACTTPEAVRRGYPRLDEWLALRRAVDPHGVWQSDLARRLGLVEPPTEGRHGERVG